MSSADTPTKRWTVLELLNWTTTYLEEKGIENSRLNVEMMLAHVLGCKRVELYLDFDRPLIPDELQSFKSLLKRRTAYEPLQYVLGETEFMGYTFQVGPGVLVPRPETEILVEMVRNYIDSIDVPVNVLDVGTGSGCIALSIAALVPDVHVTAVDRSADALRIAQQNATALELANRVEWLEQDALKSWPDDLCGKFDVIVSNPPYVSITEYEELAAEIKEFEPEIALLAGQEGLDFYQHFLDISVQLIKDNGRLFFEIGEKQAKAVCDLYLGGGYKDARVHKDLAEKDRVVELTR